MATEADETDAILEQMLREIDEDEVNWSNTVQVGDWVDARDDGFYLSGPQYRTKDKLYQVRAVDIRADADDKVYSRTVIVDSDYLEPELGNKPQRQWLGSSRVIVRDGKVIWESKLQRDIKHLLANRHLSPGATEAEWAELAEPVYEPDLSVFRK